MKILYFAWLRERVGRGEEDVSPPADVVDVAGLVAWLRTRSTGHESAFAHGKLVRCAVDQEFATPDTAIAGASEIAFFPPVTGG
jgi:molybdopterin converting factor subunit 1